MSKSAHWIQTYTRRMVDIVHPQASDIDIRDIAHALSNLCRFNGHTRKFYSVAQHCVHASEWVAAPAALPALLHDAAEYCLTDVPSPIKPLLGDTYKHLTQRLEVAIFERFGVDHHTRSWEAEVKRVDLALGLAEAQQLMSWPPVRWWWEDATAPLDIVIKPWSPDVSERRFLERFNEVVLGTDRVSVEVV